MNDAERLIRLEEEAAFQEQKLEALHLALTAQQKQIDKMQADILRLAAQLQNALDALEETAGGAVNEKPPHYL